MPKDVEKLVKKEAKKKNSSTKKAAVKKHKKDAKKTNLAQIPPVYSWGSF